jgi:hypothetical protein
VAAVAVRVNGTASGGLVEQVAAVLVATDASHPAATAGTATPVAVAAVAARYRPRRQGAVAGGSGIVILKVPNTVYGEFSGGVTYTAATEQTPGFIVYSITATSTTAETVTFRTAATLSLDYLVVAGGGGGGPRLIGGGGGGAGGYRTSAAPVAAVSIFCCWSRFHNYCWWWRCWRSTTGDLNASPAANGS